jgi:hydrogenase maturation protease
LNVFSFNLQTFNVRTSSPSTVIWSAVKTIIIGLGNPILGDDGVGWRVAEQIRESLQSIHFNLNPVESRVEIDFLSEGGLSLMERLVGYERAILIDAIQTGQNPVGTVSSFPIEQLTDPSSGHMNSAHDTSLRNAIQMGRSLGAAIPDQIMIVTIEASQVYEFCEKLTPPVLSAVPIAVQSVINLL